MTYPTVRVYLDLAAGAYEQASTWTEITDHVYSLDMGYGRSSAARDFQPGRGYARLNNNDGRFDPFNTAGPYYPDLHPRNRVKVEATLAEATYLIDPFASGPDSSRWDTVGSGGVTVGSGLLQVTSATTATTRGLSAVTPTPFYDLAVKAESVSMTATPWPTSASFYPVYLRMDASDTEAAWWQMTGGGIYAAWKQPSMSTQFVFNDTHSNATYAYLRVRRHGHTTMWESSTDGLSWTTRAQADVGWQHADTCTPRILVTTTSSEGSTDTMSISGFDTTYTATHALAYGWAKGWPQRQTWRDVGEVELEWSDALTVLSRTEMPESVYDHVVESLSPVAWYKLQDRTKPILEDSSGNSSHGQWGTMEEEQSGWAGLDGRPLPASVLKAGEADTVIPASGRPGMAWARLQAEIAQPIGGATQTPRVPVAAGGDATRFTWDDSFSVETWFIFRTSFVIGETNTYSQGTIPRQHQVFVQWGDNQWVTLPPPSTRWQFMVWQSASIAYPALFAQNSSGVNQTLVDDTSINFDDGQPHQVVFTFNGSTKAAVLYVDGASVASATVNAANPLPATPALLGGAWATSDFGTNFFWHLQSITGDFVFYGDVLTSGEVEDLWYAGRYGSLTTDTRLTAGQTIDQALDLIGWQQTTSINTGGHYVRPDVPKQAGALDYIRKAARSEDGAFYQHPDGTLTFLTSDWPATLDRAHTAHWQLSDDGTTHLSYSNLDFTYDDETLVNDMSVTWADGTQHAQNATSVATYGRSRERADTILDEPEPALQLAHWNVAVHGEPRRLISRPVIVQPVTPADFAFVCSVEFGSRIELTRTTPDGRTVTDDYIVQAVTHRIDPGQFDWSTSLTLEPADQPGQLFTLDTSFIAGSGSELDGDDVLGF